MQALLAGFAPGPIELLLLRLVLLVVVMPVELILFFVKKAPKKTDTKDQQSDAPPVIETKQND